MPLIMNIEGFSLYLLKGGRKQRTVNLHIELLKRLQAQCGNLTIKNIERYFLRLKEAGRKATYINDYIDTLHVYGRYKGVNTWDKLTYFKEDVFVKATMSDEEIESFLALPPVTLTRYHWKKKGNIKYSYGEKAYNVWTLFFKILAYSGMRPGEVAHLKIENVDFGRQVFILEDTKTNTPRYVPIAPTLVSDLEERIKNCDTYLFPSLKSRTGRQGEVVDDVDWGYNFHQRLKRLGIKRKNLTPYSLRHSFITRMLDEDVNLFKVQKIVGHRRIDTTALYTHLTTKDIVSAIKKDPLSRQSLPFYDRLKAFRDGVRVLLSSYALSPSEEKEMLSSL